MKFFINGIPPSKIPNSIVNTESVFNGLNRSLQFTNESKWAIQPAFLTNSHLVLKERVVQVNIKTP